MRHVQALLIAVAGGLASEVPLRAAPAAGEPAGGLAQALLAGAAAGDDGSVERRVDPARGLFTSAADPALELPVPEGFEYLGRLEFPLDDVAWVDLHLFADHQEGRIRRLVLLQFEGFVDTAEGSYRFAIPAGDGIAGSNYRFSPERIDLGGHGWVHNTWAFDLRAGARDEPGRESDRILRLLETRGLEVVAGWIMSRFVREVGPERRDELILFYLEPLDARGRSLAELPDGGPPSALYDELSAAVTAESLAIFRPLRDLE
jgi:hypothetical protein